MTDDVLPLEPGDSGEPVRDLQRRLAAVGFVSDDTPGVFGRGTVDAVTGFQRSRGLEGDGRVGSQTWAALIEAAFRLGDRLLYLRTPMYRGDDVAELQRQLGSLGFNAGRVDGVFGPDTAAATEEFQRNVGVTSDAVVGPETIAALGRVGGRASGRSVAAVLEAELLRSPPTDLAGARLVLGDFGGAEALTRAVARRLGRDGATVTTVSSHITTEHADLANGFEAAAYVGVVIEADATCRALYFSTEGYESVGGRHLAGLLAERCATVLGTPSRCEGMRLPVLRATRMPAVVCRLGPGAQVVRTLGDLAEGVAAAIEAWVLAPLDAEAPA